MLYDSPSCKASLAAQFVGTNSAFWPNLQVNYFPSRFDPVRHAEKYPYNDMPVSGRREKTIIRKVGWCSSVFGRFVG